MMLILGERFHLETGEGPGGLGTNMGGFGTHNYDALEFK